MPKKEIPDEYICEPFKANLDWLDEYKANRKKVTNPTYQQLKNYFSYRNYSIKPFNEFTLEDVKDYIDIQEAFGYAPQTIASYISALSTYKKYLINKYPDIFYPQFLCDLDSLRKPYEPGIAGNALNLVQLSLIRQFNNENHKIKYVFELLFQLNPKKQ